NRTINKELQYFGGFLSWVKSDYHISAQLDGIRGLPYKRPLPAVLTPGEVNKILEASDPFWRALILCLYGLGLRWSEATQLRKSDVDLKAMSVKMIQKGGNEKSLPLSEELAKALEDLGAKDNTAEYIFLNEKTKKPVSNIRKALQRACKTAEVTKRVTPHLFRHSFATHLMDAGVNMRIIQTLLGHSQIGTTEFYTHVSIGNLRDAANKLY
ncbi:MAG TPA: hypothetical protein DCG53_13105, partial [Syntrophus sp. (in: bacteria)]|nr:hypothetical protein [Syntrophus sp. (in: bacteria)]